MGKKIKILTKSELHQVIKETLDRTFLELASNERGTLLEMATFGVEKWGNDTYKIAVHAASTNDSPIPHLHIYLNTDRNPYSQFNFEISLIDILCKDEINLIFQYDRARNVNNRNRTECSWTGYREIKEGITKFLFSPCGTIRFGNFSDNLERGIFEWNRETDYVKTINNNINVLREYFEVNNLKPLPKYEKYLKDYNDNNED